MASVELKEAESEKKEAENNENNGQSLSFATFDYNNSNTTNSTTTTNSTVNTIVEHFPGRPYLSVQEAIKSKDPEAIQSFIKANGFNPNQQTMPQNKR